MSEEKSPPTEEEPVAQTEETSKPEGNAKEKESSGGSGAVATIEKPKVFVLNETEEKLYESSDDEPYDGPVKYFKIEYVQCCRTLFSLSFCFVLSKRII